MAANNISPLICKIRNTELKFYSVIQTGFSIKNNIASYFCPQQSKTTTSRLVFGGTELDIFQPEKYLCEVKFHK